MRRPNDRLVTTHSNNTVEETVDLFGSHKNTAHEWLKKGLPLCDEKRLAPDINDLILERIEASRINDHE